MTVLLAVLLALAGSVQNKPSGGGKVPAALNFTLNDIGGKPVDLAKYQGKVVLVVNVASECGYTPQYAGLQELHKKYEAKGLTVLGFPSNDFGAQEPGSNSEIAEFCQRNYGVEFDMFSKIVVRGRGQAPLYAYLTKHPKYSGEVDWNFEKFLIGRNGEVIGRFKSGVEPLSREMVSSIESALAQR
jgi:glutathione peroxidase